MKLSVRPTVCAARRALVDVRASTAARATALIATACAALLVPVGGATAAPGPVYSLAGGCYALQDTTSGDYVTRDARGYGLGSPTAAGATAFRMKATALGSYLLYGPDRRMPQVSSPVTWRTSPALPADWWVREADGGAIRITSKFGDKDLTVGAGDRLTVTTAAPAARWRFVSTTGCATFPELETGTSGTPFKGATPDGPVRGFVDTHTHISAYRFLGGRFHCGRPWSPYGVTVALKDCPDHGTDGSTALAENLLSYGTLAHKHTPYGWPSFTGWPTHGSKTHESTYWVWLERAWRGGLRLMVNDVVENRALCEIYPLKQNACDEMVSARSQVVAMHELQDYIDAQFGGPGKGFLRIVGSPEEARHVINEGKLAVVLGIEVSEILNCRLRGSTPTCTADQIDQRLTELHALGVQSAFVAHKFDNALAGTTYDDDATGLLVNVGNKYATGRWWSASACPPGAVPDNTPPSLTGQNLQLFQAFGEGIGKQLLNGSLPIYPPGPLCNPRGLTDLGAHFVRKMADLHMIVEADHLSVRARTQTLDLLQSLHYPGVISSHSWSDHAAQIRIQQLGGFVAPYGNDATVYVDNWRRVRSTRQPGLFGIGYGSDSNGLGAQPGPRPDASVNPVTYPYTTFDGGTTMTKEPANTRTFDVNKDGVADYGLFPDWVQDLRTLAGPQIVDDMANGAEAYLELWERARGWTGSAGL